MPAGLLRIRLHCPLITGGFFSTILSVARGLPEPGPPQFGQHDSEEEEAGVVESSAGYALPRSAGSAEASARQRVVLEVRIWPLA